MNKVTRRIVAVVCTLACATTFGFSLARSTGFLRTDDRNGDGRPDLWRFYDSRGRLIQEAADTNFDGRWDRQEEYVDGDLIQRQLDRNFDDRIDVVEYFDRATHEHVRSLVDVGFDGRADLLILFQHGRPVFSEREYSAAAVRETERVASLLPLADPFSTETAISSLAERRSTDELLASLPIAGAPEPFMAVTGSPVTTATLGARSDAHAQLAALSPTSLRGPPLSSLL